jgi:hypothetical protein
MRTINLTFFYRTVFILSVLIASRTNSSAESQTGPAAYFKLGEMYQAVRYYAYLSALSDKIDARFKELTELAKSLGAPQAVLDDVENVHKVNASLPFAKPWSGWTDAQQKVWYGESQFFKDDLWRNWIVGKPFDNAFFWFLGQHSLAAWYGVQAAIAQRGETISTMQASISTIASSLQTLLTDSGYTHAVSLVTPETVTAMKSIAAVKAKLDDPLSGGISMEDVNALGNAGKTIHDLNTQGKILK